MRNMISVAPGFQYSVNIGYDLGNDNKLINFIPTKSAMELLEDILLSVSPTSSDRARVLIGAYGKGKSHIILTILSLLMKRDKTLFKQLMPKVEEDPRLLQLVRNYYESDNKILPVIISGSNTSLTQAFLVSLQHTLSDYDLLNIMPDTNYQAAISVIRRWEKEFPETFSSFCSAIDKPVEVFLDCLENFDVTAYETFERIYPTLTAGSVFNPFLGFDVVDLYESVAKSLKEEGYSGIYVIYDEFSKYLEANIVDATVSDTKMLQDFAEKCCRSGSLQMHLMLVSHKEISNYIDKLPKEKTDGWRGVSERFKHVLMNNNFIQTYEIISAVIQHKEPFWSKFCNTYYKNFESLYTRYQKHMMFIDAQTEIDTAITGCFPLQPVSTFILPRLSERIAQNERTLFTFLSSEGSATLPAFLDQYANDFSLVTPDQIYDYFEPLLRKEIYAGEIHKTFVLTSAILARIPGNILGCKIVKTISLIYMLEQFERLSPTKEEIIGIYHDIYKVEEIEQAIADLVDKELVVYIKRSNDYLRLKQTSGIDINQKIHDLVEVQSGKVAIKEILNGSNFDNYMYPSRYNDAHEMTRFFAFQFISGAEVTSDVDWDIKSESINADGVIYGIIPENEAQLCQLKQILKNISDGYKRFIFALPKKYKDISGFIREYSAVSQLRDQSVNDPVLFDEYEVVFEDLQEIIRDYISDYTHPEKYRSDYINDGKSLSVFRKSGLTEVMSLICDEVYSLTPVINNESVNKNTITNTAQNSRNKIISALLRAEFEPNLGLSGTGQEVSIMRSTLIRTGIWSEDGGIPQINLHPQDSNMCNMLETIESFILEARHVGRVNFEELYKRITAPEYHIGLRYGLIPIYLAVVMHDYRQQIVISDRFGPVTTSADILIQINNDPGAFSLEYLDWNPEKEEYIERISEEFSKYIVDAEKTGNEYDYVANALHRWYMALPKYSKECIKHPDGEIICRQSLEMVRLLRQNTSSFDLLFKKLPETFGMQDKYKDTVIKIIETKDIFDNLLEENKQYLIVNTKVLFLPEKDKESEQKTSLITAVKEWCDLLDPKSFEQLFPDGTDRFLQHLKNATNDEEAFIVSLAKLATGLRIEDWDSKTINKYFDIISQYMKTAKEFHSSVVAETINDTSNYQVIFADVEGAITTRRFDKVEVSARGKLLFNQIMSSIEAMGHSITEQEKRQILMEVLKKLC